MFVAADRTASAEEDAPTDPEPLRTEHLEWAVSMVNKLRQAFGPRLQTLDLYAPGASPLVEDEAPGSEPFNA
jgi:hypothetical protein